MSLSRIEKEESLQCIYNFVSSSLRVDAEVGSQNESWEGDSHKTRLDLTQHGNNVKSDDNLCVPHVVFPHHNKKKEYNWYKSRWVKNKRWATKLESEKKNSLPRWALPLQEMIFHYAVSFPSNVSHIFNIFKVKKVMFRAWA